MAVHYHANAAKAAELTREIVSLGRAAVDVQADVGDKESVFAMGNIIRAAIGDPDIVVANAVQQIDPWQTVLDESIEDYESQFRSCVLHNVLLAKAFVPAMRKKGWGRFVGINTECTMQCKPTQSAYVSGKGGQDRVLRVLAKEVGGDGITVNQVAPGWTISDRYRETGQESQPEYEKNVPLRRRGDDFDIANAVAFLASDLAAFITGVYLPVCGGNVMPAI